jgi:aminopeptidase N
MFEEFLNKHPLLNLRAQPDDSLFDATTYKKGAVVLHMLRETVGDDVFWKTLNVYLNRHKFGVVETSDLQKAFEETSGQKLNWFFDQWVRKAGYPKLKITPTYNPRSKKLTLTVRQTQVPDSQTPEFFRFRTDVEIITPWSAKTEKVEIIGREQTFTFDVGEKPIEISFDKSERVLKKMEMAELKLATAAKNTAE